MQDMLVPIFGENGAIIIQYAITLAVILGLIVLVVWGIRRFGGGAARPAARARLPRLAVVDSLDIDSKRRLVLVRRDNVEHLVLIGGPSDVVVEPSIVRQRVAQRPGQPTPAGRATQPAMAAPQPPPPPPPPAPSSRTSAAAGARAVPTRTPTTAKDEPGENAIPFPPRRSPLRASERFGLGRRESAGAPAGATALATSDPLIEPAVAPRSSRFLVQEEAEPAVEESASSRFAPPARSVIEEPDEPVPGYPPEAEDDQVTVSAFAPPAAGARPTAEPGSPPEPNDPGDSPEVPSAPPTAETEPPESAARPAEVSDLEKEMARLLDEISTSRRD